MNAPMVAVRTVHFLAVIVLFGELAFLFCVAQPALRGSLGESRALRRHFLRATGWSLCAALGSGVLWLIVQAAAMSNVPLWRALDWEILDAVLNQTLFGRVLGIRFAIAIALGATLFSLRLSADAPVGRMWGAVGGLLAGSLLASIAWAGHAVGDRGLARVFYLATDAAHLLAAGAWLGGLPPLMFALARAQRNAGAEALALAARIARRFSALGLVSVGTLVLTGLGNASHTVGSFAALMGTDYGRLLLIKLLLFSAMVSLAAVNRLRLTPRLDASSVGARESALKHLWRNAVAEMALGLLIVAVVGALGITFPAFHSHSV